MPTVNEIRFVGRLRVEMNGKRVVCAVASAIDGRRARGMPLEQQDVVHVAAALQAMLSLYELACVWKYVFDEVE